MQPQELPDYEEIERQAREHLDRARNEMSAVRDWLGSDWRPPGPPVAAGAAGAHGEILRITGKVKGLIDEAKRALERP